MSSTENCSSSGVRNLRSLFENKTSLDPSSPDTRGRSPSCSGSGVSSDKENIGEEKRQTSNVRASFVPVELAGSKKMAVTGNGVEGGTAELKRESSAGLRRGSFSEADGLGELRKTISVEQEGLSIPETAVEEDESVPVEKVDKPPENSDKAVTGAEEEPSEMKPAEPTNVEAVGGDEALPSVPEDLLQSTPSKASPFKASPSKASPSKASPSKASPSKTSPSKATPSIAAGQTETEKPKTNGKPATISTEASSKASSSAVRPSVDQPKTPLSAKSPASSSKPETPKSISRKTPMKKASRSSLTAPTAASMAHSRGTSDKSSNSKTSPTSKPKAREATKPVDLPSHLTAPTASSRAKHERESASTSASTSTSSNLRSSTSRSKPPTSSARPTPRSSLAPQQQRPESRNSQTSTRRSTAPAAGSLLERMMRPTAASAGKSHEKVEAKTSPKSKGGASKPKVNGHPTKPAAKATGSKAVGSVPVDGSREDVHGELPEESAHAEEPLGAGNDGTDEANAPLDGAADDTKTGETRGDEADAKAGEVVGNETPIPQTNGTMEGGALEATPAGLGGEETIR